MKILIIDDEKYIGQSLYINLKYNGYSDCEFTSSALAGQDKILTNDFDVVFLDIMMPEKNGLEILDTTLKAGVKCEFIMLTAVYDIPTVVKCLKTGAFDYIVKPLNSEFILTALKKIEERILLKNAVNIFTAPMAFNNFITGDQSLIKLMDYALKIAVMDCNILITGESGSGKGIFAKTIHNNSLRKHNSFISINVNTIPEQLFESSLFGFKKGSFTGADKDSEGFLHSANNGTLFLDEIGDLDTAKQVKLLKVIEEKEFFRVGSTKAESSNFRLITATNKNLFEEMKAGRFRQDLYYRIKSSHIHIPPLRERGKDIIVVANTLMAILNKSNNLSKKINSDALVNLLNYEFRGNFREIQHIIEKAYFKSDNIEITTNDFEFDENKTNNNPNEILSHDENKIRHIKNILKVSRTKNEAAKKLGISRTLLYKYLKKIESE